MSQCPKWRGGNDEQVSENLVAFSFQFFTRLGTVFAEEFDDFVKPISLFHLLNPVVLLFETTSL